MDKRSIRTSFLILVSLSFAAFLFAQPKYYTKSKKAISNFESALYQYKLGYYDQSKLLINQALIIDDQFIEAYILLGEIAKEENQKEEALKCYQKAISINDNYQPLAYLSRAEIFKSIGKYAESKNDFLKFSSFKQFEKEYGNYVLKNLKQCDFAIELMKNPVDFHPQNLGPEINTSISEYWPSLTADDSVLVYTVSDRLKRSQEDLYTSSRENISWKKGVRMPPPINTEGSEGAQTISADGKTMVFTACLRSDSYGSCDLYISKKKGKNWSKPVNMGNIINTSYKESQPSLSADGNTIYFVSNRPEGKGKFDIWKSTLNPSGTWSAPENLGDSINTAEDELAPFIHYDNQTLYFSSEGHLGMGGSDIFISRKDVNGIWSMAKNAGYPINTNFDEESLIVTANGDLGFFSSNMDGGYGQKDIYQFKIPQQLKPKKVIFAKGLVYNSKSLERLQAQIEITDLSGNSNLFTESDTETGEFLICLIPGKSYAFNVNKTGYMFYSETLLLKDSNMYINIPLVPIELGKSTILKNIFFNLDSFQLKEESFPELQKLLEFIKSNKIVVEIQGHTDNTGTVSHNQKLSENRAKSVFNYLISNGLDNKYLKYKGYGASKPIAGNETEIGRAKNRRTEFVIIGKE
jgi:outer membrane protein OmpA-like peptidoglycan-associated protein/Tol biopolymer transport system component